MPSPTPPDLEGLQYLSQDERRARRPTLPSGEDFWVFGYGSLMWQPGFPHVEVRPARLRGLHRSFCVYSHRYRGTPKSPGLVLGLDRGGSCHGMAFRVPSGESEETLDYLFEREMLTGVYHAAWRRAETREGPIRVLTFVADRGHRQYAGGLGHDAVVALILQGYGDRGACLQYLENTVHHLRSLGLKDAALERLLSEARRRSGRGSKP